MISSIVSRLVILVFGTLYPAYASYKAVRTKNVKEYVKWMMYWIVFALFTCAETFTDVFLSFWFPFYYEIKIILVLWLLSPATKGSSILYRKFVHPMLSRREQEIDEYIAKAKEQGYHTVLHLGTRGVNYATTVLMQTAIKGGGGLVNQIRRSYSLSDLSSDKESDMNRNSKALKNVPDEDDMEETDGLDPRMLRPRGYSPRRSASGSGRVEMYFPEVDVDVRQHGSSRPREPSIPLSHIRSSEDVSSGYSSAEPLYAGHHATKSEGLAASREPLVRTASVGSTRSMRTKSSRGGVVAKRGPSAEDSDFFDLPGDEADYDNREEFFNNQSSALSSQPIATIPLSKSDRPSTPLATVPEVPAPPPPLTTEQNDKSTSVNDVTAAQDQFVDASDDKPVIQEGDEELPLFDAETDESKNQSNEFSLSESLVSSTKHDISSVSSIETPSSKDLTISTSGISTNDTVPHPFTLSAEIGSASESSISHSQNVNDTVLNSSTSIDIKPFENIVEESSRSNTNINKETEVIELDVQKTDITVEINNKSSKETESFSDQLKSPSEPEPLLNSNDMLNQPAQPTDPVSEVNKGSCEDVSTAAPSLTDETVSESLPAIATPPLSARTAEPCTETSESNTLQENISDIPLSVVNINLTNQEEEEIKQNADDSMSAYDSVESLSVAESPSRSNSQCSLRKESRAGRYHKLPAPTPPPKTPEAENVKPDNQNADIYDQVEPAVSPTLERKDLSEDTATGSDDSEAAVTTARLVLKPGVVRNLGPDANTKAEVFVSKAPSSKSKKSKSKHKHGESGLSRFFTLPKNQFGSLTSLIPFWHGKNEPSASSAETSGSSNSNTPSSSFQSSSSSAFVPVQQPGSSSSTKQVNEDGKQFRAPLANCE